MESYQAGPRPHMAISGSVSAMFEDSQIIGPPYSLNGAGNRCHDLLAKMAHPLNAATRLSRPSWLWIVLLAPLYPMKTIRNLWKSSWRIYLINMSHLKFNIDSMRIRGD